MHIDTKSHIDKLLIDLPQSILVTGLEGIGLGDIVAYISEKLKITPTYILPEKDEKIDLEKGIISVQIIRRLYDEVRTKSDNKKIIVIDLAERMTVQAQNAFLKLLEEPSDGVHFILLSHNNKAFLPTVLSGVTKVDVKPITLEQSNELLDELMVSDSKARSQILFIAAGLPAEICKLAKNSEYFEKRSSIIRDAKTFLTDSIYQKILTANRYKDSRSDALILMNDTAKMLQYSLKLTPDPVKLGTLGHILKTCDRINANANIRLAITRVALSNLL